MEYAPDWFASGYTARDANAFQGRHEEHVLIIFDEGTGIEGDFWDAAEGMMTGGDGCFTAGHAVAASAVSAASAKWYEGDVVHIVTVNGGDLTVTPNHPILTPQGWVAAGLLQEGDDVIGTADPDGLTLACHPDDNQVYARFEDVAGAFDGPLRVIAAMGTAEGLNRGIVGEQVNVVRAERLLSGAGDATVTQEGIKICLVDVAVSAEAFPRESALKSGGERVLLGALGHDDAPGPPDIMGLMRGLGGPVVNPGFIKCALDDVAGRSVLLCYGEYGSSGDITVHDCLRVFKDDPPRPEVVSHRTQFDAVLSEVAANGGVVDAELPGNLDRGFPGLVRRDQILSAVRFPFSGHVYNLQTRSGWYVANSIPHIANNKPHYGIIAHNCHWLVILNPTDTATRAYDEEQSGDWNVITIAALDHPNIAAELAGLPAPFPKAVRLAWLLERIQRWCTPISPGDRRASDIEFPPGSGAWYRPGPLFEGRVMGRWPTSGSTSVWTEAMWLAAQVPMPVPDEPLEIGCDVARYGDDYTSIVVRRGPCVLHHETHNGWSTSETAGRLKVLAKQFAAGGEDPRRVAVKVDDDGVGGGVTDKAEGFNFLPVSGAGTPAQPEDYPNRRSELWFTVAERADQGRLDLSRLSGESRKLIRTQVMAPKWKMDADGRRAVEVKDVTKVRVKRSPDDADALNLAFARPPVKRSLKFL